ncbi:MAG: HEAT repeat domain-containing protein [Melioribacteraceae bacterium]|nr:HEAT repeat domain-containing protein [Melioribacteraceae bacterium]
MLKKSRSAANISFLIVAFLISFSSVFAQESKTVVLNLDENAYANLKTAIQSENPGLRKSGIYYAGKYSVNEVSETLLAQLKDETDPSLRILILRVLYILEDDKFTDDIYEVALNDEDTKVRKMASAIYSVMQVENSVNLANRGN